MGLRSAGPVVWVHLDWGLDAKKKPNGSAVFVSNLFLGWNLPGSVVALAMAAPTSRPLEVGVV